MNDKPILFSAPMIRALLEGRKTQTRRIIKPQPSVKAYLPGIVLGQPGTWGFSGGPDLEKIACPYNPAGGLLWVRETFRRFVACDECGCSEHPCPCPEDGAVFYRADENYQGPKCDPDDPNWKPSIFMPRVVSRITLEIKDIRVERLHDLKGWDCAAEGIMLDHWKLKEYPMHDMGVEAENRILRKRFKELWQSINGPDSWDTNPWVWVVNFDVHPINIDDFIAAKEAV